ncbi:MAG TPA: type II secretion system protein GspJ [Sedimentisphaerales bacterium]|nr:type II secretion system protein GspJ [Sedimentisphaerales bacterium]
MRGGSRRDGFTLVEVLLAATIIATILSMAYGSYFAATRSAQVYRTRTALSQEAQKLLEQMARQIRCSYAEESPSPVNEVRGSVGTANRWPDPSTAISHRTNVVPEKKFNCFNGNCDDPTGEILHMVTTKSIFPRSSLAEGLFEVTYRFDRSKGRLSVYQRRFTGVPESLARQRNWQPVAENIDSLDLAFFDGGQWLKSWSFEENKNLPGAVKIELVFADENGRRYCYDTVPHLCCRINRNQEIQTDAPMPDDR